ncbi:uncharacterized protein BXZ73DRAFT_102432 [Epithele typhae]|uniref:uncharacterized protein n=1 Tax=Epithele typhae TaxID=378194 RepID=UPI00200858B4|nr:uncharacterized protein BXZ73DRAFT_102432 [Epithele typhae]KAH9927923.1 hypothetical protein BXZ73DRAFT_102432 [Epithele typhae]
MPLTQHLTFATAEPAHSAVLDGSSGKPLYDIRTSFLHSAANPRLATAVHDVDGHTTSLWLHRSPGAEADAEPEAVLIRGAKATLIADWLHVGKGSHPPWQFRAPDGRAYVWKEQRFRTSLKLVDVENGRTVARSYRNKSGLDYDPTLRPVLDVVLLAYVVCEERRSPAASQCLRYPSGDAHASARGPIPFLFL